MQKILCFVTVIIMFTGIFSACRNTPEPTEPTQPEGPRLWYAYNTENFMQDMQYPELMDSRDSTLRFYTLRGDVESAQLMITPDVDVKAYEIEINDLVNENGEEFSKKNFEIFTHWYIEIDTTYNADAYLGYYPDPLVPYKQRKRARENSIAAGQNQGIWINATIPEDTAPGLYTGTAELKLDKAVYEIPIELTVYDLQMPEQVHPQSCFLIWYHDISVGEGYLSPELSDAYYWFLVEKRIMPYAPQPSIFDSNEEFIAWLEENIAENPKISSYGLPYEIENSENGRIVSRKGVMNLLTAMAKKNIEMRQNGKEDVNLFERAYYYLGGIIDEPTGEALERVKICDLILTECKFAVADQYLTEYPDLYNSLIGLTHIVTTAYNEDLIGSDTEGGVHTWCPTFEKWHGEDQRQNYYDRQNTTDRLMGEGAWWYSAWDPKVPFPTYHMDDQILSGRLLSWMQYDYGSEGNLYWDVNLYSADIWTEPPFVSNGTVGDGLLIYPGSKYNLQEPISTLRLESIREGQEDYELFWMMEQGILQYNEENGTDYDPEALMAHFYDGLYDGMIQVRNNSDMFHQRRIQVLETLELFTKDPAAGIAALENGG